MGVPPTRLCLPNDTPIESYGLMVNRHGPVSTATTLYVPESYRFHEISRTSMTTSPASLGGAGTIA